MVLVGTQQAPPPGPQMIGPQNRKARTESGGNRAGLDPWGRVGACIKGCIRSL
jgi:hypothetical protein